MNDRLRLAYDGEPGPIEAQIDYEVDRELSVLEHHAAMRDHLVRVHTFTVRDFTVHYWH